MPELPEVETICRGLASTLIGKKFINVQTFRDNLRFPFPSNFTKSLEGRKVAGISRRAKYIFITLDNNTTLIMHLGMSGRIIIHTSLRNAREKHDHVVFHTDDGNEIVFNDPRRFGMMDLADSDKVSEHKLIKNLGLEPLESNFSGEALHYLLRSRKVPVKLAIMNANLVVGVGNIYACESLFRSNIIPTRSAGSVSPEECNKLSGDIKIILQEAIKAGGSTLKDYVTSSGKAGYFQHNFKVYGRENDPCVTCGNPIKKIVQGGRSTFFCGACQK